MPAKKFVPSQVQIDVERYAQIEKQLKELDDERKTLLRRFKKYAGKTLVGIEFQASVYMQVQRVFMSSVAKRFLTAAQWKKCIKVCQPHVRVRITPFTGSEDQ